MHRHQTSILLGLAIIFSAFAYNFSWAQFLYIVGPVLFFLSLRDIERKVLWKKGFIYGFGFYGLSLLWLFSALPFDWAGLDSTIFGWFLVGLLWLSLTFLLTAIPVAVTYVWSFSQQTFLRAGIVATTWAALEYLTAFVASLVVAGEGGIIGAHWAWISFGDLLAGSTIFIEVLRLGGLFGGSFFIIFVAAGFVGCLFSGERKETSMLIALFIFVILTSLLGNMHEGSGKMAHVVAIQTNNTDRFTITSAARQREIWQNMRNQIDTIFDQGIAIDVIVLPEDVRFSFLDGIEKDNLFPDTIEGHTTIIDSGRRGAEGSAIGVRYLGVDGETIGEHDKTMLVPAGEYMPFIASFIAQLFGQDNYLRQFSLARKTKIGDDARSVSANNVVYGTLPCVAVVSPLLYRNLVRDGTEVLVNAASQSLLNGNRQFFVQIRRRAQVHAASLSRPYVQASNGGEGLIIDRYGKILQNSEIGEGYIRDRIALSDKRTGYVIWGNWWLGVFVLLMFALSTCLYMRKNIIQSKVL